MKISEAIKFIINQNDKKLLTDSNRFKSYLLDLCSDHQTELKIVKRALEDKTLERIFGNDRENVKIARLRDEFEAQGMSEDWREFIISSFAEAIGWNYTPKTKIQQQPQIQQVQPQQPSSQVGWTCSCGCVSNGNFCSNCGLPKPVPKVSNDWTCVCGAVSNGNFCSNCGLQRGQQTQQVHKQQLQQVVKKQGNLLNTANIGDYVKFGNYPQTANGTLKPIEWKVLTKENNKILLISRYGLEAMRFDRSSNKWKNSEIRKWLNGDFYNRAFNDKEKKLISSSNLSTTVYYKVKKETDFWSSLLGQQEEKLVDTSELTDDYIFLLTKEEAEKYFANDNEISCKATDYVMKDDNKSCYWWLRSPYNSVDIYFVDMGGRIRNFDVFDPEIVARPAIWINI